MRSSVHINEPCQEHWDNMSAADGGRFCGSCQKVVTDFSGMNNTELANWLKEPKANVCGRFRMDQVSPGTQKKHFYSKYRFKAVAFFALLFSRIFAPAEARAQGEPMPPKIVPSNTAKSIYTDSVVFHIGGSVTTKKGPLPFASLEVKVNGEKVPTVGYCDGNGNFTLDVAAKNDQDQITIIFRKRRYHSVTIDMYEPDGKPLDVKMHRTLKGAFQKDHYFVGRLKF